jgi:hypothetical protein
MFNRNIRAGHINDWRIAGFLQLKRLIALRDLDTLELNRDTPLEWENGDGVIGTWNFHGDNPVVNSVKQKKPTRYPSGSWHR